MAINTSSWQKKQKFTTVLIAPSDSKKLIYGEQGKFAWALEGSSIDSSFFSLLKSDGSDLRVTLDEAGEKEIPFDLVHYNSGSSTFYLRMLLDVSQSATTEYWIWGGNPSASAYAPTHEFGSRKVWGQFDLSYIIDDSILSGSVTDRTGNHTLSQENCSSANFVSSPRGQAFVSETGNKRIVADTLTYNLIGTQDFTIMSLVKAKNPVSSNDWIGVFGNRVAWDHPGAGSFFFRPSAQKVWWEFPSQYEWEYTVTAFPEYVDITEWSMFSATRFTKSFRVSMLEGMNQLLILDPVEDYNSTEKMTIGSADDAYPLMGYMEEFHVKIGGTISEEYHNTMASTLTHLDEANTASPIQDGYFELIVTVKAKVLDFAQNPLQGARVYIEAQTGGNLPFKETVTISRSGSIATVSHTGHGIADGEKVTIRGATRGEYNGTKIITVLDADSYTYGIAGNPPTPAVGTITSTAVIFSDITDANGELSRQWKYFGDQPVGGRARSASGGVKYRTSEFIGNVLVNGMTGNIFLIKDE